MGHAVGKRDRESERVPIKYREIDGERVTRRA